MARFASIDIGTNSVLLLVAEKQPDGTFTPVIERAEITRLGRGVDKTRTLSPEGMAETLKAVIAFADEARHSGAQDIAVSATSAARDATNGKEFLDAAKKRARVTVEIISGELEAQLSFTSAYSDFARNTPDRPLVVLDIGGGSTEFIYGETDGKVRFRHSFDVGSVRLTERFITGHPVPAAEREQLRKHLRDTFSALPPPPERFRLVGVAGTVTTLYSVLHAIDPYDSARVHGQSLPRAELTALATKLCDLPLEERRKLPGLQPKRADVICAGALILEAALERLNASECLVSDRGLRWGLLAHRFGDR